MEISSNNNDIIKTFLKIDYSENKKEKMYEIDDSKKLLTLFNFESFTHSETSFFFEFDKIFTNSDSNSYIYEEICLNCIKEFLQRNSFSVISFGETISNKYNLLYGNIKEDFSNINNYGLAIHFLNDLNNHNQKLNIKWSYFLVYEDNLVDLSLYEKENKTFDENNLSIEKFLEKAYKIKNDKNIIEKIKKKSFDSNNNSVDEIIRLINKIINELIKLEEKGNNLYSLSHFCMVIYLFDKNDNILSNVSFIQLNGNEHLYNNLNNRKNRIKKLSNNFSNNKNNIDSIKGSYRISSTYDDIFNSIQTNIIVNNSKNLKLNEIKKIDKKEKDEKLSKLSIVLYNICLGKNIPNIKFRIIGNIKPITGFYKTTRDTLLFVSKFEKIFKKPKINNNSNDSLYEEKNKEILFDLNYQLNSQIAQTQNLLNLISKKDEKIYMLTNTYNKQITTLKNYLGFKGDINILLSGDKNTAEYNFVNNLKNSRITIKQQEFEIKTLKEKLDKLNNELIKYKNIYKIKENDKTMISYFISAQNLKEGKSPRFDKEENAKMNNLEKEIINLKNKINMKDKIIEELKKDLNKKNNIFCNLPKSMVLNNNKKKEEENEMSDTYIMLKNEIKKLKINEQKNNENIKLKYKEILNEKKNKIYNLEHKLEGIEENYKSEINMINKELVRLYEIILYITTNYQKIFCSDEYYKENNNKINDSIKNKKQEFDEIVKNIIKDINYFNFYGLHKELEKQNKTKESIIKSLLINKTYKETKNENNKGKVKEKTDFYKKIDQNEKNILIEKDKIISKLNNKILKMAHYINEQTKINNNNTIIINSQKRTIDKMNNDSILQNKSKNNISHYDSHLALYKKILKPNNSNIKSIDYSLPKNKIIKDYFNSFYKINESINNGSFHQPSTRSNNLELKETTNNSKSSSVTNRLNTSRKVFLLKKNKRPFSSYINKKGNFNNHKKY